MSHRNSLFTLFLLGALLLAARVSAGETPLEVPAGKTNKMAYNASVRAGESIGKRQVQRAFLNVGTNQIAFMIPGDFSMDASDPQKIRLTDPANGCFITVRIGTAPEIEPGSETSFYRAAALNRFPGAIVAQESSDFVANHSGPAFNLKWANSSGASQSARINFIPTAAGVLEFSVMAPTANFKDALNSFEVLIGSVQNNENGKIVIVPLPDFS